MPVLFKKNLVRRRVVFPFSASGRNTSSSQSSPRSPDESSIMSASDHKITPSNEGVPQVEELAVDEDKDKLVSDEEAAHLFPPNIEKTVAEDSPVVPDLFTNPPRVRDSLVTETSISQDSTAEECLPLLAGSSDSISSVNAYGLPSLKRRKHIDFLRQSLERVPAGYVGYDASRPWVVYWALTGLCLLGEEVSHYQKRVTETFTPMQNPDGGFGSGHGQMSHCLCSYAAVLSLAMVGGDEALGLIDRKALWKWLGDLKQSDGGFTVGKGGEEDVRGAYCAMVMISLLRLPLELPSNSAASSSGVTSFVSGLPEYISRCQTFEGGISGAPGFEGHGAYAFCALACLCILDSPHEILPKYLDLPLLISWLSARQNAPEGGFTGRTNKLVDGCYSYWVGGCWPFIEAALHETKTNEVPGRQVAPKIDGSFYSREGLIRYILCCCQSNQGGLRDKPSKRADGYHSCYVLAGLSSAQHRHYLESSTRDQSVRSLDPAFRWKTSEDSLGEFGQGEKQIFNGEDRLMPIHPIFVIPFDRVVQTHRWFSQKAGF